MEPRITAEGIESRIEAYKASLKEWDAKLDQLEASARIEYEQERDGFSRELAEAWKDLSEAKLEEYAARIEGAYQNLKTRWSDSFGTTDDNDSLLS